MSLSGLCWAAHGVEWRAPVCGVFGGVQGAMTDYTLRTLAIVGAPFGFMALALAGYLVAYELLPIWWFRTDACPEREVVCGQMPPILFVMIGVGVAFVVFLSAIWRTHREAQTDV